MHTYACRRVCVCARAESLGLSRKKNITARKHALTHTCQHAHAQMYHFNHTFLCTHPRVHDTSGSEVDNAVTLKLRTESIRVCLKRCSVAHRGSIMPEAQCRGFHFDLGRQGRSLIKNKTIGCAQNKFQLRQIFMSRLQNTQKIHTSANLLVQFEQCSRPFSLILGT